MPDGSATAKAIDYSLNRWAALTRYLDDGDLPADNNWVENQIRPIAIGRNNWLFAGSLRAGKRAAAIMSLVHSARLNGHDPYAYLKDVLERLPTQPASRVARVAAASLAADDHCKLIDPPVVKTCSPDAYLVRSSPTACDGGRMIVTSPFRRRRLRLTGVTSEETTTPSRDWPSGSASVESSCPSERGSGPSSPFGASKWR